MDSRSIPTDLTMLIQKELTLNQEVSLQRKHLEEKKQRLNELLATVSVPEKIGLTRVPFSPRRPPNEALRKEIAKDQSAMNDKAQEWRDLKSQINNQLITLLAKTDKELASVQSAIQKPLLTYKLLSDLRTKTEKFINSQGHLRGALLSGFVPAAQSYSKMAAEEIKKVGDVGFEVDAAILKIQDLEISFHKNIAETFASDVEHPEVDILNVGDRIQNLITASPDHGHATIEKINESCRKLVEEEIPKYEAKLAAVQKSLTQLINLRVDEHWQTIREQIWCRLHNIAPTPVSDGMQKAKVPPPAAVKPKRVGPPPVHPRKQKKDFDKGKGLTDIYFEKPSEKRSSLKLKVAR